MSDPGGRPIRVLLFSPDPSLGGGVVEFNEILLRTLGPRFEAERFVIGRRPGSFGRIFRVLVPLRDAFRLAHCLLRSHHDVYHFNPSLDPRAVLRDGLFLLVLRIFRRRNVLVFFRGWNPHYFRSIASSAVRRRLFLATYGRAARLLVLSSSFAGDLASIGIDPSRIHLLTTMFDGGVLKKVRRNRIDAAIWILFLARFETSKGMYDLLEAFKSVRGKHRNTVLILAGDGVESAPARAWCRKNGLQDSVRFPGYITGNEKAQLLVDSDIFALPSYHQEGCPNALLEAMGAGLPVVVTPVGGIPDVVTNGVNGLILQAHDPAGLDEALERLIQDPALRAEMGNRNRDKAWREYEAQSVTDKLERHYESLAGVELSPHDS